MTAQLVRSPVEQSARPSHGQCSGEKSGHCTGYAEQAAERCCAYGVTYCDDDKPFGCFPS